MSRLARRALVGLCAFTALAAAPAASAAPGDLDPTFGAGGQLRLLESKEESSAEAVAVQADGKIVVAGYDRGNAVVLRLLPNGSLDPAFGSGGMVTTVLPTGSSQFRAVVIQPDGRIVGAGSGKGSGNRDFFFARFNADGSPDLSFGGGDGIELIPVGAEGDQAEAMALGPSGRIVAAGSAEKPGNNNALGVVVLQESGTPDPGFGGGVLVKETSESFDSGVAIAALEDGSLVIGDANGTGGGSGLTLMKLRPNGEYDSGFGGGDGIVVTPIRVEGAMLEAGRISDLIVISDGRIVAVGAGLDYYGSPPTYHSKIAAVRYLANGDLDPSFASGGIFTHRVGDDTSVATVHRAEAGGYLLTGSYLNPGLEKFAAVVLRLTSGGSLDPAFGAGGVVARADTAPFGEGIGGAAVDSEDRLLTVGVAYGPDNGSWVSVARYLGDPRPQSPVNLPARARMKAVPKKVRAAKLNGFAGSAGDPDGNGVQKVQIALVRMDRGTQKAKASARKLRCFALKSPKPSFRKVKAKSKQCAVRWLKVKGKAKWRFKLKGTLPAGRYVVFARATDGAGLAEAKFSRKLRNRYAFRVLPSR